MFKNLFERYRSLQKKIMGSSNSKPTITEFTKDELKRDTEFKDNDAMIDRLLQIYQQLERSYVENNNNLTPDEFTELMGMSNKEIGKLIYNTITKDRPENINFITPKEFITGLNIFHPNADRDKLIEVVFDMYKDKGQKELSQDNIETIINISANNSDFMKLSQAKIKNLAKQLFQDFNEDGNKYISHAEFRQMVNKAPGLIESLRLNLAEILPPK